MFEVNDSEYDNNSYTFFGPMGMAFYEDGNVLDDTYTVKVILSVYLGVAMAFNIVGNICTCAVIARNRSMRTPTNCYLFNLAITDLLTALFIPLDIYIIWIPDFYPLGEVGCRFHFLLWDFINNCSILIITAFTIERYLVVTRPFMRQKLGLTSRVFKIVGAIWLVSCLFIVPDVFYIDLLERKKYVFCYINLTVTYMNSVMVALEILVFSAVPMVVILFLYVLITIELKSSREKLQNSPICVQQNKTKAVKMLAAVSASFFIFWSPYCALRIMHIIPWLRYETHYNLWKIMNYLSYVGYMSTITNPILYSLMSRKFRLAFKDLLQGRKYTPARINTPTPNSISSSLNEIKLTRIKFYHHT